MRYGWIRLRGMEGWWYRCEMLMMVGGVRGGPQRFLSRVSGSLIFLFSAAAGTFPLRKSGSYLFGAFDWGCCAQLLLLGGSSASVWNALD